MSILLQIIGDAGNITLEILHYENPEAVDCDDRNWVKCDVSIRVKGFNGAFAAAFMTRDFVYFRRELVQALSQQRGRASFITCEDSLRIDIEFLSTGGATVTGMARVVGEPTVALSFSFSSDQSFLKTTLRELDLVVREFPIR